MSKEAMKLALEALDIVKIHFTQNRHVNDAITALREALAKPDFWEGYVPEPTVKQSLTVEQAQQEPTCKQNLQVWVQRTGQFSWEPQDERFWTRMQPAHHTEQHLEMVEQPAQQQEPFVTKNKSGITLHVGWDDLPVGTKLYTSPRRTWVGLSDAQNTVIWANSQSVDEAIRATEKQLMENNI